MVATVGRCVGWWGRVPEWTWTDDRVTNLPMIETPIPVDPAAAAAQARSPEETGRRPSWRALLRPTWHWLRNAPDRAVHGYRRRVALGALRRHGLPDAVVFICHGNIYRSPYGAAVLAAALPVSLRGRVRIVSAGFIGPDRPSPDDAQAVARERSLDLSAHRSRLLGASMLSRRALCLVVEPAQIPRVRAAAGYAGQLVLNLGDLDPDAIATRAVADPWGRSPEVLRGSYARIERCVGVLAEVMRQSGS